MRLLTLCCAAPFFAALSACAKMVVEYPVLNELPQARDDAALVYFFKTGSYYNRARNRYVYVDGGFLGAVKEGSFFFAHIEPGVHNFSCLVIEVEAGQTYYLENTLHQPPGIYAGNQSVGRLRKLVEPRFTWVSPEHAAEIIPNLTYTIVRNDGKTSDKTGFYCELIVRPESYPKLEISPLDITKRELPP